jgi:alpha-L-fucosidase
MKKLITIGIIALTGSFVSHAAANEPPAGGGANVEVVNPDLKLFDETEVERTARMEWWQEAKFGLFIHWGIYAVPAGSYGGYDHHGEWLMHYCKIPVKEYQGFANQFNPVKYDPDAWVKVAKDAGMRYIVITSKHHEGFTLYPSKASAWNVADATPYGKDLLGPLVDAAKKQDLKIGFYFSQAQDWMNPGGAKATYEEGEGWDDAHKGDFDQYLQTVALPQVKEIFSQYPIDIFWWDTPTWMNEARIRPFAEAIPRHVLTNNRLGGGFGGDFSTPEQFVPTTGHEGNWETCMTMNDNWGYCAADKNWKSSEELIHKLIDICAKGGNFLLNVGPNAEGEFPAACIERLQDIGGWMDVNGDAIYGTTAGPFTYLSWGAATRKGKRLYLHVFDWPADGKLRVPMNSKVAGAALLVDPNKPLTLFYESDRVVIELPEKAPDAVATVVILDLAEEPIVPLIASGGKTVRASSAVASHQAGSIADGRSSYWEAKDADGEAWLEFDLGQPTLLHALAVDEPDRWPRYRQTLRLEVESEAGWKEILTAETKGHGHTAKFDSVTTQRVRLYVERAAGAPAIAEWQLYSPE